MTHKLDLLSREGWRSKVVSAVPLPRDPLRKEILTVGLLKGYSRGNVIYGRELNSRNRQSADEGQ